MMKITPIHKNSTGKEPEIKLPWALAKAIKIHIHVEIIIVAYACNVSFMIFDYI